MTSLNTNIFRVAGPLWGESTGHPLIPETRSFDVSLDLRPRCLNIRLSKQSRRRWFGTPLCSSWRHYNAIPRPNGQAIGCFCEDMGGNWPRYKSTALYQEIIYKYFLIVTRRVSPDNSHTDPLITWANVNPDMCRNMAPSNHNRLLITDSVLSALEFYHAKLSCTVWGPLPKGAVFYSRPGGKLAVMIDYLCHWNALCHPHMLTLYQKQVSTISKSNRIPLATAGCEYVSMSLINKFGTKVFTCRI